MKKVLSFLWISLLISIFLFNCQSDTFPDVSFRNISVDGYVVNENGQVVENASVEFNAEQTTTDNNGYFQFPSGRFSDRVYIKVTKPGYFDGSRTLIIKESKSVQVHIRLLEKSFTNEFQSSQGGVINYNDRVNLEFLPNSILDEHGANYNGPVKLAIQYLDPANNAINETMPGNLIGLNSSGDLRGLTSYAMVAVELQTPSGSSLKINPNKPVNMKLFIPVSLREKAPSSIPLWHFDENAGLWKEEGAAIKNGNYYEGKVSHFSFWNCDDPFPILHLKGLIIREEGRPVPNALVKLTILSNNISATGYTNAEGIFEGGIPYNEELYMEVFDYCGNSLYQKQIGPFNVDVDLGTIILPFDEDYYLISGQIINQSNVLLPLLPVELKINSNKSLRIKTNDEGRFTFHSPSCVVNEMELIIYGKCSEKLYNQKLPLIKSDLDLGQITVPYDYKNKIIFGQVINESMAAIPDLKIIIQSPGRNLETKTNQEGKFSIQLADCSKDNISIVIQGSCGEPLYNRYLGEVLTDLDLGSISLVYKGIIKHTIKGKIVNAVQEGIPGLKVIFTGNNASPFSNVTDDKGEFEITKELCNLKSIWMTVKDYCDLVIESRQITLDNEFIDLAEIVAANGAFKKVQLEGKVVDCQSYGLQGVSIIITSGQNVFKTTSNQSGNYNIAVPFCNTNKITIKAYDSKTQVFSEVLTYNYANDLIHIATLQVCKDLVKADEYLSYQFSDGVTGSNVFNLTLENSFGLFSLFTNTSDPWFNLKWNGPGSVGTKVPIKEISLRNSGSYYIAKYYNNTDGTILFKSVAKSSGEFFEGTFEGINIKKQDVKTGQLIETGIKASGSFKIKKE